VVLFRRLLILGVVNLSSDSKAFRLTYVSIVNILILLAQMGCMPYLDPQDNRDEALVLVVISLISVVLATAPSFLDLTYKVLLSILCFATALYLLIRMIYARYQKHVGGANRKATRASTSSASTSASSSSTSPSFPEVSSSPTLPSVAIVTTSGLELQPLPPSLPSNTL
jgi:hypothetical protein